MERNIEITGIRNVYDYDNHKNKFLLGTVVDYNDDNSAMKQNFWIGKFIPVSEITEQRFPRKSELLKAQCLRYNSLPEQQGIIVFPGGKIGIKQFNDIVCDTNEEVKNRIVDILSKYPRVETERSQKLVRISAR